MNNQSSKLRQVELARGLRQSQSIEHTWIVEILSLRIAEMKNELVNASGDNIMRLQGSVRELEKLRNELTTVPPTEQSDR